MRFIKTKLLSSFSLAAVALAAALVLLFAVGTLEARLVGQTEAWTVAARLLEIENERPDLRLTQGSFELDCVEPLLYHNRPVAYLVRFRPQGFMILSDITEVTPQVFISYEGDPELLTKHPILVQILHRLEYNKVHLCYLAAEDPEDIGPEAGEIPDPVQVKRNEHLWSDLERDNVPAAERVAKSRAAAAMGPLLTSTWNQDAPYWNYTPLVGGQHTYTGCVATAIAQIMNYWQFPSVGQGIYSYWWNGRYLSADFRHSFPWDQMRASYSGDYTDAQANAVARLMSDIGISVNMDYGTDSSGAYTDEAMNALPAFFFYDSDINKCNVIGAGGWDGYFSNIMDHINILRPVLLSIYTSDSGHAVVADGYRTSPSDQLHINMGWGGAYDNYYSVSNIYGYGNYEWDYSVLDIHPPLNGNPKLTILASNSGTTNPAPGVQSYPLNTSVKITAIASKYVTFFDWTGIVSGTANPVTVVMNQDRTIKANFRFIYAPAAAGEKVLNRSFSQAEYIDVLTWTADARNAALSIDHYNIYLMNGSTPTLLGAVDAADSQYLHRNAGTEAQTYRIAAVTSGSREGAPATVTVAATK